MDLIPGQGTCLGCGFSPLVERIQEKTDPGFSLTVTLLSFTFSLPSPLSKTQNKTKTHNNSLSTIGSQRVYLCESVC